VEEPASILKDHSDVNVPKVYEQWETLLLVKISMNALKTPTFVQTVAARTSLVHTNVAVMLDSEKVVICCNVSTLMSVIPITVVVNTVVKTHLDHSSVVVDLATN